MRNGIILGSILLLAPSVASAKELGRKLSRSSVRAAIQKDARHEVNENLGGSYRGKGGYGNQVGYGNRYSGRLVERYDFFRSQHGYLGNRQSDRLEVSVEPHGRQLLVSVYNRGRGGQYTLDIAREEERHDGHVYKGYVRGSDFTRTMDRLFNPRYVIYRDWWNDKRIPVRIPIHSTESGEATFILRRDGGLSVRQGWRMNRGRIEVLGPESWRYRDRIENDVNHQIRATWEFDSDRGGGWRGRGLKLTPPLPNS